MKIANLIWRKLEFNVFLIIYQRPWTVIAQVEDYRDGFLFEIGNVVVD